MSLYADPNTGGQSALIEFGGRFPPCMKLVQGIPIDSQIACLSLYHRPVIPRGAEKDMCQVLTTRPTHQLNSALSKRHVPSAASTATHRINGSGQKPYWLPLRVSDKYR
jgi:hypothetical protein